MGNNKKTNQQYFFTVEGDTEKWYLDHLQKLINLDDEIDCTVTLDSTVEKSPLKYAKRKNNLTCPNIIHLCDIESKSDEHQKNFKNVLEEMQKVKKQKHITYELGYSNFSFELWIVLHKKILLKSLNDLSEYLPYINDHYDKKFKSMHEYKSEKNFKELLEDISLDDVKAALRNAETLEKCNLDNGKTISQNCGFKYYLDNPSLSLHKCVEKIFDDLKISY